MQSVSYHRVLRLFSEVQADQADMNSTKVEAEGAVGFLCRRYGNEGFQEPVMPLLGVIGERCSSLQHCRSRPGIPGDGHVPTLVLLSPWRCHQTT